MFRGGGRGWSPPKSAGARAGGTGCPCPAGGCTFRGGGRGWPPPKSAGSRAGGTGCPCPAGGCTFRGGGRGWSPPKSAGSRAGGTGCPCPAGGCTFRGGGRGWSPPKRAGSRAGGTGCPCPAGGCRFRGGGRGWSPPKRAGSRAGGTGCPGRAVLCGALRWVSCHLPHAHGRCFCYVGARLGNCEGHNAPLAAADFSVRGRYPPPSLPPSPATPAFTGRLDPHWGGGGGLTQRLSPARGRHRRCRPPPPPPEAVPCGGRWYAWRGFGALRRWSVSAPGRPRVWSRVEMMLHTEQCALSRRLVERLYRGGGGVVLLRKVAKPPPSDMRGMGPSSAPEVRAATRSDSASDSDRPGDGDSPSGRVLQIRGLCHGFVC